MNIHTPHISTPTLAISTNTLTTYYHYNHKSTPHLLYDILILYAYSTHFPLIRTASNFNMLVTLHTSNYTQFMHIFQTRE